MTIEACATSNVHTGVIASVGDHPLPKWTARGVRACINTDNTLLSAVNARAEYANARAIPGMTDELFEKALAFGHAAAFRRREESRSQPRAPVVMPRERRRRR